MSEALQLLWTVRSGPLYDDTRADPKTGYICSLSGAPRCLTHGILSSTFVFHVELVDFTRQCFWWDFASLDETSGMHYFHHSWTVLVKKWYHGDEQCCFYRFAWSVLVAQQFWGIDILVAQSGTKFCSSCLGVVN